MDIRLDGRSALITGGSTGLGLAMAREFAASGAEGLAAMGKAMAVLKPRLAGRADMAEVSRRLRARLST